jgi:3-oxo-5-alpha-steroid 4-dehydrogenase 1
MKYLLQCRKAMLYRLSIIAILAAAPLVFVLLAFVSAPYGRHFRKGWGPSVTARLGWLLMESPSALIPPLVALFGARRLGTVSLLLLALWEVHYVYRAFAYPFLMGKSEKRFPLSVVSFAWIFNGLNAYGNAAFLSGPSAAALDAEPPYLRLAVGIALFAVGLLTNAKADRMLRELRANGSTGYSIPRGWLFDYVVSPNYLGEMIEWCGWAVACWSLPALAFAVFTAANLVPRAVSHRRWYEENFEGFPPERKSVIPFLL